MSYQGGEKINYCLRLFHQYGFKKEATFFLTSISKGLRVPSHRELINTGLARSREDGTNALNRSWGDDLHTQKSTGVNTYTGDKDLSSAPTRILSGCQ